MEYHGEVEQRSVSYHGVPWRVLVWSTGTENWYGEVVWKPGSLHGVARRARVETSSLESHEERVQKPGSFHGD